RRDGGRRVCHQDARDVPALVRGLAQVPHRYQLRALPAARAARLVGDPFRAEVVLMSRPGRIISVLCLGLLAAVLAAPVYRPELRRAETWQRMASPGRLSSA